MRITPCKISLAMLLKYFLIFATSGVLLTQALPQTQESSERLRFMSTPEIIELYGYPAETHHVTTEDGYILEMHRIPYGRAGPTSGRRPPVFLMHGLLAHSSNYVAVGPEYSIGFNLADEGFDVWMGNARGNRDSRRHVSLDPDGEEDKFKFWDFTWEQIGFYDIAAMTDYARNYSRSEKIHYVGHSQGGTVFLVLNSLRPEYNRNFASAHLLAPAGYKEHFPNTFLSAVALFSDVIWNAAVNIGFLEIGQNLIDLLERNDEQIYPGNDMWTRLIEEIRGGKDLRLNIPEYMPSFFGGAALKQIAHYGQNVRTGNFQRWDFGLLGNREVYGTLRPPRFDLSQIDIDITIHYAVADTLIGVDDVLEMARDMPNAVARKVARDDFGHADFAFDSDVKELVTDYMIEKLKAAENM